jgi:hypothetical protein
MSRVYLRFAGLCGEGRDQGYIELLRTLWLLVHHVRSALRHAVHDHTARDAMEPIHEATRHTILQ